MLGCKYTKYYYAIRNKQYTNTHIGQPRRRLSDHFENYYNVT